MKTNLKMKITKMSANTPTGRKKRNHEDLTKEIVCATGY
jgi:hypothetical protein